MRSSYIEFGFFFRLVSGKVSFWFCYTLGIGNLQILWSNNQQPIN